MLCWRTKNVCRPKLMTLTDGSQRVIIGLGQGLPLRSMPLAQAEG
jgi:hypothetical protein